MARLSKSHRFAILEDTLIPAHDSASPQPLESISNSEDKIQTAVEELELARCLLEENDDPHKTLQEDEIDERDFSHKRRSSVVSAYPESIYQSDHDVEEVRPSPHTPLNRPNLRHIDALQKLQILSAPQPGCKPSRRPWTRLVRSKNGTPKVLRSMQQTGSPRRRRRISEQTEALEDDIQQEYPLVLLHVTLVPVDTRWSEQVMREVLPPSIFEQIKLLRWKVSETLSNRGILVQHPQEEYDLLEERILEALELKAERLTKCGHFRGRDSMSSNSDAESGVGSSIEGCNGDICTTCQHRIKTADSGIGDRDKKWVVKVFAANGLLRASAWVAAWSDMESVDVEILPWMSEDLQRQLDERAAQDDAERDVAQQEAEEDRIRRIVDEQVEVMRKDLNRKSNTEARERNPSNSDRRDNMAHLDGAEVQNTSTGASARPTPQQVSNDTQQACQRSEIPLAILLRNYVYLLARDWRNVAIFVLGVLALSSALLPVAKYWPNSPAVSRTPDSPGEYQSILSSIETSEPVQVVSWKEGLEGTETYHQPQGKEDESEAVGESLKIEVFSLLDQICPRSIVNLFAPALPEEFCPIGLEI